MSTVLEKKGDQLTRAINFIDGKLQENPQLPLPKLISQAGAQFNLSPKDEEYLSNLFKKSREEPG